MTITDDKGEKFKITGIVGSNGEERLIDVNGYSVGEMQLYQTIC